MIWTAFVLVFLVGLFISGGMRERRSTARCKGPSQALSLDTNARVENHRHRCSTSSEQLDFPMIKTGLSLERKPGRNWPLLWQDLARLRYISRRNYSLSPSALAPKSEMSSPLSPHFQGSFGKNPSEVISLA